MHLRVLLVTYTICAHALSKWADLCNLLDVRLRGRLFGLSHASLRLVFGVYAQY